MKNLIINECKYTYIEPVFKDEAKVVKLLYKGERITDYITFKEAFITIKAMLEADKINAEQGEDYY